ncbi:MAG: hypothetical protein ACT452_20075, partial [Microthrixaceae bacterium]
MTSIVPADLGDLSTPAEAPSEVVTERGPVVPMTPTVCLRYLGVLLVAVSAPILLGEMGILNDTRALVLGEAAALA